jgi:hypothetical protein
MKMAPIYHIFVRRGDHVLLLLLADGRLVKPAQLTCAASPP